MEQPVVKKGLLIGINYIGTENELRGCINDTENLHHFLTNNKYMCESELIFMNDKMKDNLNPTKINMVSKIGELLSFANEHINEKVYLFLSYSGHGSYIIDQNGDEDDGRDEVLCPADCMECGFIVDDDLKKNFIDKLGSNVTLVIIIDACHSGTVFDLKYLYNCDRKNTYSVQGILSETKCKVVMISGCKDEQTSADAYLTDTNTMMKEYQGAMTAAFINNYTDEITTNDLINNMRKWLKLKGYSQNPQLSSGRLIDLTKPFILSKFNDEDIGKK